MSISYLYNSDILKLSSKTAQIIALRYNCVDEDSNTYEGLIESAAELYPYAIFHPSKDTKYKPGTIKILGNEKGQRKILAMFFCYRKYYFSDGIISNEKSANDDTLENRAMWLKECLLKIARIKGLKSIAFPGYMGCDNDLLRSEWKKHETLLIEFAKDNPTIKVVICFSGDEPNEKEKENKIEKEKKLEIEKEKEKERKALPLIITKRRSLI